MSVNNNLGIGVVEERCVLVCRHAAYSAKPAHTKVPFGNSHSNTVVAVKSQANR